MSENLFYKGTLYFWELFQFGICFLISNGVLLLLMFGFSWQLALLPAYLLALVLVIPALEALFLAQRRWKQQEFSHVFQLYYTSYRDIFREGLILGSGYGLGFTILLVDLYFITTVFPYEGLFPFFTLLWLLLGIHLIYTLLIRVKLIMTLKDTIKLSCYLIIKAPITGLKFIGLLILSYLCWSWVPQFSVFLLIPFLTHLLLILTEKLFVDILKQFG